MKKVLHIVIAVALLLSSFLFVSCGENDELPKQAMEYLKNKYEKDTFEFSEIPKTKSVTGRYEFSVRSDDDGIDFDLYVYAFFITDSYSVTKANVKAQEKIRSLLNDETLASVKSVTVYPVYDDGGTDYRFTSVPLDAETSITDIDSIVLNETDDSRSVAALVKSVSGQLDSGGLKLEHIRFVFDLDGYTVNVDTDTGYILSLDADSIGDLISTKIDGAMSEKRGSGDIFADRSVVITLTEDAEPKAESGAETAANTANKKSK